MSRSKRKEQDDAWLAALEADSRSQKKITSDSVFLVSAAASALLSGFVFFAGWQLSGVVVRAL